MVSICGMTGAHARVEERVDSNTTFGELLSRVALKLAERKRQQEDSSERKGRKEGPTGPPPHILRLFSDEFAFAISPEDQERFKVLSPIVDLSGKVQPLGVREFELQKRVYADNVNVHAKEAQRRNSNSGIAAAGAAGGGTGAGGSYEKAAQGESSSNKAAESLSSSSADAAVDTAFISPSPSKENPAAASASSSEMVIAVAGGHSFFPLVYLESPLTQYLLID